MHHKYLEPKHRYYIIRILFGEVDERFKSPPWKGGTGATLSRVRIPPSPPKSHAFQAYLALLATKPPPCGAQANVGILIFRFCPNSEIF